jgi:hypothetical protein
LRNIVDAKSDEVVLVCFSSLRDTADVVDDDDDGVGDDDNGLSLLTGAVTVESPTTTLSLLLFSDDNNKALFVVAQSDSISGSGGRCTRVNSFGMCSEK